MCPFWRNRTPVLLLSTSNTLAELPSLVIVNAPEARLVGSPSASVQSPSRAPSPRTASATAASHSPVAGKPGPAMLQRNRGQRVIVARRGTSLSISEKRSRARSVLNETFNELESISVSRRGDQIAKCQNSWLQVIPRSNRERAGR